MKLLKGILIIIGAGLFGRALAQSRRQSAGTAAPSPDNKHNKPLVLDVDGTFLRTDMLFECFWAGLGKNPFGTLRAALSHFRHPQVLKRRLADIAGLNIDLLPINPEVAKVAKAVKKEGREIFLASASDKQLVEALAQRHGFSDQIFASDEKLNLKGVKKADALVNKFGERGFDYAGNEPVDRAIWNKAEGAVIVGHLPKEAKALRDEGKTVTELPGGWRKRDLLRALRPHQWVKNLLLLVPLISAHAFDWQSLLMLLLGILAFSAAASAIYIVNDLLDIEADRLHAVKRHRPFASGAVPIRTGMLACAALMIAAASLALSINSMFFVVILIYLAISLGYSLRLKRLRWADIATLAALYAIRVIAGALVVDISLSGYLLAFVFPVFLCLGCVKRLAEASLAASGKTLPGRNYGHRNRASLRNVSVLCAAAAVAIFLLYGVSPQAEGLYPMSGLLWFSAIPLMLWLVRMVMLGYAGKMDYDPIVFVMKDAMGLGLILLMLAIMFLAAGFWQQFLG